MLFFIFDSTNIMDKVNLYNFDGVVILINSPNSLVPLKKLNKINSWMHNYFYYPLWDDHEIQTFLYHFEFPKVFDDLRSNDINIISEMGLEGLRKTQEC
jgi:hypothetical protein